MAMINAMSNQIAAKFKHFYKEDWSYDAEGKMIITYNRYRNITMSNYPGLFRPNGKLFDLPFSYFTHQIEENFLINYKRLIRIGRRNGRTMPVYEDYVASIPDSLCVFNGVYPDAPPTEAEFMDEEENGFVPDVVMEPVPVHVDIPMEVAAPIIAMDVPEVGAEVEVKTEFIPGA